MNLKVNQAFNSELKIAQEKKLQKSFAAAWYHLERAHILSQAFVWPHIYVHWRMFVIAVRTMDFREILGQIPRLILAGPGSFFGRAPKGNTGRSNVGIFTPMKISDELERILHDEHH